MTVLSDVVVGSERVIHTCKHCKVARAFDYTICERRMPYGGFVSGIETIRLYEREGEQPHRYPSYICPTCRDFTKTSIVVGQPSDKRCGASCRTAKSKQCICSCAGKEHGAAYLNMLVGVA